ncbi:MAG TPA: DUF58 domain-containing protein [Candidatus Dormibacteraeota bacterium]|jgi:uncharacterized protein (DUF58 family)|nr:DUF58 domain-containing protein [Candidatus Dormibacteraeota bacterium]
MIAGLRRGSGSSAQRETLLARAEALLGLSASGLAVAGFAVLGWIVARALGGRSLYLLAYVSVLLLAAAWWMARRRRPVSAERSQIAVRVREGQTVAAEVTLRARRRVTSFIVEERLDDALGAPVRIAVGSLGPGRDLHHRYSFRPRRRGVYRVGPLEAEWTDPFGLARSRQHLLDAAEVIVHPSTEVVIDRPTARKWEDPPVRPPVSRAWPAGFEFYGMRDYVAGDDLRRVVWRASARTGRLLVREFEQGITDRIVVVLDTDRAWHRPGEVSDTFEAAVRCAASLGVRHLQDGFSVGMESCSRRLAVDLRGPRARIPLLDALARVEMESASLRDALDRVVRVRSGVAHHVVITPRLDAECASRLRMLIDKGGSVLVAAVVWEESDALTVRRAVEIGAQVVEVRGGAALGTVFAHPVGAGTR